MEASTRAQLLVGQVRWSELTNACLGACGKAILAHVATGDEGGLFSPIEVEHEGKWRPGGVLTLQDRAVFGWWIGTFRVKNFEVVLEYSGISEVVREEIIPSTRSTPEKGFLPCGR